MADMTAASYSARFLGGRAEGVLAGISAHKHQYPCPTNRNLQAAFWTARGANIRDIQEPILILVLLVDAAHQRSGRWQDLIDEDEDGLLGRELDALADDVDELPDGEVGRHQVLLLVDGCDVGFFDFFADHLQYGVAVRPLPYHVERMEGLEEERRLDRLKLERLTGIRSAYFWRIRSASALRFSKGCSSLNLDRMLNDGYRA